MALKTARITQLAALVAALSFGSDGASAGVVTFEGFSDSTVLTNQIAGLTFSHAVVLTAGVSLNGSEFPPHSGVNVVLDLGGPLSIAFASPETSVGGFFTYAQFLELDVYDASNTFLGSVNSTFSDNFVSSGNPPNEFLSLSFPNISKLVITGDPSGGSFVLDDLQFSDGSASVPEPLSISLLGAGLLGLVSLRRRAKVSCSA